MKKQLAGEKLIQCHYQFWLVQNKCFVLVTFAFELTDAILMTRPKICVQIYFSAKSYEVHAFLINFAVGDYNELTMMIFGCQSLIMCCMYTMVAVAFC